MRVWLLGVWLASLRAPRVRSEQVDRFRWRAQTRGMGVRLTEALRDRLRRSWLRLRGPGKSDAL